MAFVGAFRKRGIKGFSRGLGRPSEVTDSILLEVASWNLASSNFGDLSLNDIIQDWQEWLFSFPLLCDK